ncbi:MAG: PepSY-associated TM helix domain-containing protein [Sphingomonas taxi]
MTERAGRAPRGAGRTDGVRAMLSGHSILGIAFAAILYLVCLTGTLSVFLRDFQRWEQPDAPVVTTVGDAAVTRAVTAFGRRVGAHSFYVLLPTDDFPRLMLSSGGDADDQSWFADASGRLVARQHAPWIDFVQELHTRLHLPATIGRFLVGLAGVALVSSLISGVLAHPRIIRDAFHLRLGGARRLEQADWHNRLGVWPLPFHLLVSLTGALLGLSTIIVGVLALLLFRGDSERVYALFTPPPPAADARATPMPDIARLLEEARRRSDGAIPRQMTVSHWGRGDAQITVSLGRPRLIAQQDALVFAATGAIVSEEHPAGRPIGKQILGSLGQLHFGWFGGLATRIVYSLLGVALCVVTVSGIEIWLARRRDKGRGASVWERVWTMIVWGQPLILATLLAASLAGGLAAFDPLALWLAGTATSLALGAAIRTPRQWLDDRLKRATGLIVLIAGLWRLVSVLGRSVDAAAAIGATVMILAAAGLLLRMATTRRSSRTIARAGADM